MASQLIYKSFIHLEFILVYGVSWCSTKKLFDLINEFGKIAGYKVNIQILKAFLYTNNEISKEKLGENPIYCSNKKNKILLNKLNQGNKRPVLRKLHNTEESN